MTAYHDAVFHNGMIQRVQHGPNELARGAGQQFRIAVEGQNIRRSHKLLSIPCEDAEFSDVSAQKSGECHHGPALALVSAINLIGFTVFAVPGKR